MTVDESIRSRRGAAAVAIAFATAFALATPGCSRDPDAARPRCRGAVLITIDTARADHYSCYGYVSPTGQPTSPRLDAFAKEAVRFERALVPIPRTTQSLASLMTGLNPPLHGVRMLYDTLAPEQVTLAERVTEAGFKTGAFVEVPYFRIGEGKALLAFGLEQGFAPRFFTDPAPGEWRAEEVTDRAIQWLEKNLARDPEFRFVLWLHYRDPHAPYWPFEPFKNRFDASYPKDGGTYDGPCAEYFHYWPVDAKFQMTIPDGQSRDDLERGKEQLKFGKSPLLTPRLVERARALYDGEIAYTDEHVGRLFDSLKRLGLWDEVAVAFTADHGESLGEHDFYFDHGEFLYDTCLHVPLLVRAPGYAKNKIVPDLVGTIDVAPTLIELLGARPLEGIQGRSLVPLLGDDVLPPREYLAESGEPLFPEGNPRFAASNGTSELGDPAQRLRAFNTPKRLKLILDPTTGRVVVHDVKDDPGEIRDVSTDPSIAPRIESAKRLLESLSAIDRGIELDEIDPETREWMRQNGYLVGGSFSRPRTKPPK